MKKILYLVALVTLPLALVKADHGPKSLEGIWLSSHGRDELKVELKSYGLKVKGVSSQRRFEAIGNRTFTNYAGTKIRFVGQNEMVVTKKHRNAFREKVSRQRFYKASRRNHRNNRHSHSYGRGNNARGDCGSGSWDSFRSDNYRDDLPRGSRGIDRFERRDFRNSIDGTWKTQGLDRNRRVVIKTSEAGIKAKFKNSENWVFYAQDNLRPNTFVDRQGNKYVVTENGKLIWKGVSNKTFSLVRI